jgi:hypothetical protein
MRGVRIGASAITFLPVVKGLVSEAAAVSAAYEEVRPEVIALSVSREDLQGLRRPEDYELYEPSDLEIIYQAILERFGEVRLPPPAYVRAVEIADRHGTAIIPVDMNDEVYTAAYCELVRTRDMLREAMFARRATGKRYDLSDPYAFARSWDAQVNSSRGYRKLEGAREEHIAGALRGLSNLYRTILAVMEIERCDGVMARLENGEGSATW